MSEQDGYSSVHDRFNPAEAAQQVARLKEMFVPPYALVMVARCEEVQPLIEAQDQTGLLAALKPAPGYFGVLTYVTLSDLLKDFRKFEPVGEWLLVVSGRVSNVARAAGLLAQKPLGFIDTPILEKAIRYHGDVGHEGTI